MRDKHTPERHGNSVRATRNTVVFYGVISSLLGWFLMQELGILALLPVLRSRPEAIFLALVIGAGLSCTRARVILHGGVVVSMGLWLIVAFSPLAARLAQPLKTVARPEKVDAVVVLLARIQPDNEFEYHSLARLTRGLELIQGNFAPRLVLTEGAPPQGSHKAAATSLMTRLGVRGAVSSVGPVGDTHDEAVLVSKLARQQGWKRILLVTSPTHSRRATLTFAKTGLTVISTPCQETGFDLENLNTSGDRLAAFRTALREIVGLRVYRTRGWI